MGGDVEYLTSSSINGGIVGSKRGRGKESEVPMEQRLENLALNQPSSSSAAIQPKSEGMAHLLIQVYIYIYEFSSLKQLYEKIKY